MGVFLLTPALFFLPVRRQWLLGRVHSGLEPNQQLLDLGIAGGDLLLVMLVHLPRLLQRKQVLRPPNCPSAIWLLSLRWL
jgi:hypothetical protein